MELKSKSDDLKKPLHTSKSNYNEVSETKKLPSVQLQIQQPKPETTESVLVLSQERIPAEQAMAPAAEEVWDPNYCNIEETIDAFERRIKQEEARYSKLIANRHIYE